MFILTAFFVFVASNSSPGLEEATLSPLPPNPCNPTPCGPNSQCENISGQAQCSCLSNMIGVAPNCRPECLVSSDCLSNQACLNQRCIDPCPGLCGANAGCRVLNHSPFCSCIQGYTGDAFSDCKPNPVVGKNLISARIPFLFPFLPKTNKLRTNPFPFTILIRSWARFIFVSLAGFLDLFPAYLST